ncbi:MAG: tyrosine-type recombinase/integrase [Uliginosibacterium sp.]|nr:tyrosine-type recombinase/integrase [Uliginosibacterium sp.]
MADDKDEKTAALEIERAFTRDVLPYLGTFFADTITRKQIAEVLHRIVERGSGRQANVTLSNLRQCFGWAIGAGLLDADPTSHLKKEAFGGKEESRERHLSEDEIKQLLRSALPGSNLTDKAKSAVKVLLATGVRVSELLSAKREDIDLDKSEWSIAENKSDRPHVVQLSNFAASAMKEIPGYQGPRCLAIPEPHRRRSRLRKNADQADRRQAAWRQAPDERQKQDKTRQQPRPARGTMDSSRPAAHGLNPDGRVGGARPGHRALPEPHGRKQN